MHLPTIPQVFDLADNRPAAVLSRLWANLKEREAAGDKRAAHIRRCGGGQAVPWPLAAPTRLLPGWFPPTPSSPAATPTLTTATCASSLPAATAR